MKYLFIVKGNSPHSLSNSATFTIEYLKTLNIDVNIAYVSESSQIENIINDHKPTHVIIESIFVVPIEFLRLTSLYKGVKWFIRLHSDIGFFFAEIYGIEWLKAYQTFPEINIVANNKEIMYNLSPFLSKNIGYLPNIYPTLYTNSFLEPSKTEVNVGCFGNLRLLKNQGFQAVLAMNFAKAIDKKLKFHINVGKSELRRNAVLTNLRELFKGTEHTLVEHSWMPHKDFIELVKKMDIGLQLSFSESFNIVACDFIANGVPILISDTIRWGPENYKTSTIDMDKGVRKMMELYPLRNDHNNFFKTADSLVSYNKSAGEEWDNFIKNNIRYAQIKRES